MAEDAAPVRIDVWVWAVRLLKTRSLSAQACKAGHIKLNGVAVKPSQLVTPGGCSYIGCQLRG
ncbi:RNA-binding S4 domain-containing protein [Corynebacterium diphtheriae]|nr:RNA-binding S4 domain-containing protein [Corynebacterium diphtheriae]